MAPVVLQAVLERSEFSFLLQLMNARSIFGADNSHLFPKDEQTKNNLTTQGKKQLIEHGWFTRVGTEQLELNPSLALMIATIADPQIVIVTNHYVDQQRDRAPSHRTKQTVTHYLADELIMEQIELADHAYQIVSLPNVDSLQIRFAKSFPFSDHDSSAYQSPIALESKTFATIGSLVQSEHWQQMELLLQNAAVSVQECQVLLEILPAARRIADIEIGRVLGDQLLSSRTLIVLEINGDIWLVWRDRIESKIMLQSIGPDELNRQITTKIDEVAKIEFK